MKMLDLAEKHALKRATIDWQKRIATICQQHGIQARHYGNVQPFCFNVKMYKDWSFKEVFDKMVEEHYLSPAEAIIEIRDVDALAQRWKDWYQTAYDTALEDMRTSYIEDDWARFVRPHLERKYRIKVPDDGWEVKFEQQGRSGGWMVLTRFEGIEFRTLTHDPDHQFMDVDDVGHDGDLYRRKLCAYLEECVHMLCEKSRYNELLYQLAFQMKVLVERDD